MHKLTDEELKLCMEFLDYFSVDYSEDTILLTNGGNSCLMNKNSQWYKDFGGCSINAVASAVAFTLGKKTEYEQEEMY